MRNITFLTLLFTLSVSAQDVIITTNNEKISAKVEEIHIETISYKKFDNLSGPTYHLKKSDVSKIIFENGNEEIFETNSNQSDTKNEDISIEETQVFIVKQMKRNC